MLINGNMYGAGADLSARQLLKAIEPVPILELRLRRMASSEFVEIRESTPGHYSIREVSARTYDDPGCPAAFAVGSDGTVQVRHRERPPVPGDAKFAELLAKPDSAATRIRLNPFYSGTPTQQAEAATYTPTAAAE